MNAVLLDHVSKRFGTPQQPVQALDNLSLSIGVGEIVALLGPNGAGKTTAISLMLGLRTPTSGTAQLFGRDPREQASRARLGVMLQDSDVPGNLRVHEVLALLARAYRQPLTVAKALEMADLSEKAQAMAASLSGGQKKRLCFALSVIGNPDILFLDEPTAALDVEARRGFWHHVGEFAKNGKTIVLTTHYLEEADALAQRIIVINQGKVVAEGSPSAIKTRVGGKVVRFKASKLQQAALEALPTVSRAQVLADTGGNGSAEIYTLEPEQVLRLVLAQYPDLHDLEVRGGGLEEAFVQITNQSNGGTQN
jgi:ABC-2 type transport system ATP-binding protein